MSDGEGFLKNMGAEKIVIIITIIIVIFTAVLFFFLIRKSGKSGKCETWSKKQRNYCEDKKSQALGVSGASLAKSHGSGNFQSIIPISFRRENSAPRALSKLKDFDTPKPYSFDISKINFDKHLPSAKFPIKIVYTTGYESLQITLSIYSTGARKVVPFNVILDTGSSELVVPTDMCSDKQCTDIFGVWEAGRNCADYNIYNPKPVIPYGSGTIETRDWYAPVILGGGSRNSAAINLKFKGIVSIKNLNIPFFPPLCGLLPLYDKRSASFVQQVLNNLSDCKQGFIMDLRPGSESIVFGSINTEGAEIPLLTRDDYLSVQISPLDVKPIMYYAVNLVDAAVNGVSCKGVGVAIPKFVILDTGTSGILTGIDEYGSSFEDFYNCVNQDAKVSFTLENNIVLEIDYKKSSNNIQKSPDFASAGLLNCALLGLPTLIGKVISYDIENKRLIFNQ